MIIVHFSMHKVPSFNGILVSYVSYTSPFHIISDRIPIPTIIGTLRPDSIPNHGRTAPIS